MAHLITSPLTNFKPKAFSSILKPKRTCPSSTSLQNSIHGSPWLNQLASNNCKRKKPSSLLTASYQNGKVETTVDDDGTSSEKPNNGSRILFSEVVVQRTRQAFWGRKWNPSALGTAGVILAMHFLCLFAPFYFTWKALWLAFGLYVITGLLGITLCFHRNLSHRSFKLPKWL